MSFVTRWPKARMLVSDSGEIWRCVVEPGALTVSNSDGRVMTFSDPDALASYAAALWTAALELDVEIKYAAAKDSTRARLLRKYRGEPIGLRHRPVVERPEPPMHMEIPA